MTDVKDSKSVVGTSTPPVVSAVGASVQLKVSPQPANDDALTNFVYLHKDDFRLMTTSEASSLAYVKIHKVDESDKASFVYVAQAHDRMPKGCVGMNSMQRASVFGHSLNVDAKGSSHSIVCSPTSTYPEACEIVFQCAFAVPFQRVHFKESTLVKEVSAAFAGQHFQVGQRLWHRHFTLHVILTVSAVRRMSTVEPGLVEIATSGVLVPGVTILRFGINSKDGVMTQQVPQPVSNQLTKQHAAFVEHLAEEVLAFQRKKTIEFLK